MNRKLFLIFSAVFLFPTALRAQTWTNLGIGGGGAQFAPSFSPLDSNLLFLQCDMGGIYRSTNNGANFTMVDFIQFGSATDYPNGSCPIAYDPNNVNNLWAFGGQADDTGGSLLKSADEGLHWSYATQPPAGSWSRINCIVLDRGDSNFILLGTDTGAYRSTSGGTSWAACPTVSGYVWGIVIDQSSTLGNRTCYIGSSAGAFKSINEGAAWAASNTGLPGPALTGFSGASTPSTVLLYAVYDPTGSGTYNGTDIYRYINGAANWTLAYAGSNTDGFNKVECAEGAPATAYAINNAQSNTEGVWKTTDYGTTWNNVFNPLLGGGNVTLGWCDWDITFQEGAAWIQLKVDPANPNRVAATDLDCSYMTTNGGATWDKIYSTFADTNPIAAGKKWASRGLEVTTSWHYYISPWSPTTHYIAQSDIGLQRSTDGGSTWYHSMPFSQAWRNTVYEMVFDAGTSTIYAAASNEHDIPHSTQIGRASSGSLNGGVLRSQNNGVTWGSVSTGLPNIPATSILRDGAGNMYVAMWGNSSANGGVYKSTNNGTSWSAMNTGLGNGANFHAYQLKMDSGGNLYCLISGYNVGGTWVAGGIWKYPNGGPSWTYLTGTADSGNPLFYLQGFDIDSSGTTIYAASMKWGSPTQKGLYRSINGGTSWTHMVTVFPGTANNIDGFCPSVNPSNTADVYLGTENEGLWESTDAGATWSRITGVPFRNTHRVFFDQATGDKYLTTFGSSVWKLAGASPTPTATSGASTPTSTPTRTPTSIPTSTNTPSPIPTLANTPTSTPTNSPTSTQTNTSTLTPTNLTTAAATNSPTASPTSSASNTPFLTPTNSGTSSSTTTIIPTATLTGTLPPTNTPTLTATPTATNTPTSSTTLTFTNSATQSATFTATRTSTYSPTETATFTSTLTSTGTATQTKTSTTTSTPTTSQTGTWTPSTTTPIRSPSANPIGPMTVYPNPATDGQPVTVGLSLAQDTQDLTLVVFTTAFRKVNQIDYGRQTKGALLLPLPTTDRQNTPLANGLFYLLARTPDGRAVGKLIISR